MSDLLGMRGTFAARLRAGAPLTGLVATMPCAALLETTGRSGFDFAVLVVERAPGDVAALEHHVRAADSASLPLLVRAAAGDADEIARALDAGAAGIVVPGVVDAAAAERIVRAAHYPPRGERRIATGTRAAYHGLVGVAEHVSAAASTVVVAQVDEGSTVAHAGAIAAVEGVDAVLLGAAELAISLGRAGDASHPEVAAAVERVTRDVVDGDAAGLFVLAHDEDDARAWQVRGAQLVAYAAPALLAQRLRQLAIAREPARDDPRPFGRAAPAGDRRFAGDAPFVSAAASRR